MGGALLGGFAAALCDGEYSFCGYNRSPERMAPLIAKGVAVMPDALAVAREADILLLAVKPAQVETVLAEVRSALDADTTLVSVAAGVSLKKLENAVGGRCPVVRCMPNTPALVGKGVFAFCFKAASEQLEAKILRIFSVLGLCVTLDEKRFPAFSALIGAGPAYVFAVMQGLVQAGVTLGFSHSDSRRMVEALFAGSAAMAGGEHAHLSQLRDAVCSPGGLTIAGVNHLDRAGLTGILVEAVLAADAHGRTMEG